MATRMLPRRRTLHRIGAFHILRERGDTEYLLSNPEMARRIERIFRDLNEGKGESICSTNDLRRLAGL